MNNRIFYSENGTLHDLSNDLSKYRTGTAVIDSFQFATDYFYIGQRSPFNHFFVKMGTVVNTNTCQMSVDYWDGTDWVSAVEVIDLTNALQNDGFVEFTPNKNKSWMPETTNFDGDVVTGLENVVIYDLYWIRISFNGALDNDLELKFVGQKFSDDDDLASDYPDLIRSSVLTRFEAGKTTWEEQHVRAAEVIEQDLVAKKVIVSKGQILLREEYKLASVHKVAEIVFNSFGDDYIDQRDEARKMYKDRMDKVLYRVDSNADGILDDYEASETQGWFTR